MPTGTEGLFVDVERQFDEQDSFAGSVGVAPVDQRWVAPFPRGFQVLDDPPVPGAGKGSGKKGASGSPPDS